MVLNKKGCLGKIFFIALIVVMLSIFYAVSIYGAESSNANVTSSTGIEEIKFAEQYVNVELGRTKRLELIITPDKASTEDITFKSYNSSYVTVDDNGKVKAIKVGGVAPIFAETEDGQTAICKVVVPKEDELKVSAGKFVTIEGIYDDDEWKSSDETVAKVFDGKLIPKKIGKCTITANLVAHEEIITARYEVEVVKALDSAQYDDVNEDDWYNEAVKFVSTNNLMNGMGNNAFMPTNNMTRGMLVTVLYRLSECEENIASTFSDVDSNKYYSAPIAWAAKNEIVNGVGDNKFAPDNEITREQLIVILHRYAKFMKMDVSGVKANLLIYDDFDEISNYSQSAFVWGCGKNIISGRTATTLSPKGTASRAEVATMLMRFIEN